MRFLEVPFIVIDEKERSKSSDYPLRELITKKSIMTVFRKAVIKLFVDKTFINKEFAVRFSNWTNSGFSVDNSVFLFPYDDNARESLCQYIARHPVSLQKIIYEPVNKKVLYHTKYNKY